MYNIPQKKFSRSRNADAIKVVIIDKGGPAGKERRMEDSAIIELYWRRSEQAVGETAAKYGPYCMKISMNILADIQESEENVNDTYLQAWNSMPPHRPNALSAFLGRLARNLALNRYKAGRAEKRGGSELTLSLEELDDCTPSGVRVEQKLYENALSESISSFLKTQGEQARRAFVRRYFFCDSIEEIADRLNMSQSKVKSLLFRTRNKLRAYLESEGFIYEK